MSSNTNDVRTIFHVDVNSAFLSWSALKQLQDDPGSVDLRTIPSAVGGDVKTRHGIITAKSIPAKKYNIQTGEPVVKALQKCPQLVLVPSDFDTYRKYSHALMNLLASFSQVLQQVSIDEAFLDISLQVSDRSSAILLADRIRETVFEQLGFTVNVGISENKLLAKMASDFQKPDRTHTLFPDEIPQKMWTLPIEKLFGCGKATSNKLRGIGVHTIGEAAAMPIATLQALLGEKAGLYIHNSANGISTSLVRPEREKAKSISNEITLSEDVSTYQDALPFIEKLSKKVAGRMQKASIVGQTITLLVKTTDFQRHSRQLSLNTVTNQAATIEKTACQLAQRLLPELFQTGLSIRLIGVGVSKLTDEENLQRNLFNWAEEKQELENNKEKKEKQKILDELMKEIDTRYGQGTITKGRK
jgi:DNA polymerase-4